MKKIVVLALLISSFSFAQDKIKLAPGIDQKRTHSKRNTQTVVWK